MTTAAPVATPPMTATRVSVLQSAMVKSFGTESRCKGPKGWVCGRRSNVVGAALWGQGCGSEPGGADFARGQDFHRRGTEGTKKDEEGERERKADSQKGGRSRDWSRGSQDRTRDR